MTREEIRAMELAEGFGLTADHYGTLTGVKGMTFHPGLLDPLRQLRIEREAGRITPAQHAAAIEKALAWKNFRYPPDPGDLIK